MSVMDPRHHTAAPASQSSYEGISDILQCYICMGKLKDACMCPQCSKISCLHCIKKWMKQSSRSDCPHCRAKLSENDLIRVPSVQELSDVIDVAAKGVSQKNSRAKDICQQHSQQLTVYCVTCASCICTSCALWGQHRQDQGHVIKPLDDLYREQKDVLTAELKKLKERITEIVALVEQVDMRIEGVKIDKGRTKRDIEAALGNIDTRLDEQMRQKLQRLMETKQYLKRQASDISNLSAELEGKMNGSKSEFVLQGKGLKERLVSNMLKLQESRKEELEMMPEISNFVNEVVPIYETETLEITNFSERQQRGEEIYSSVLSFCGLSWRLKVHPNGQGKFTGRYLCIFVELYAGFSQSAMYHYSVELVHGAGHFKGVNGLASRNFKRNYSSDFVVGDLWGYKRFYDLNKLESDGFLVKDTLLLKFSVRHPTYHQKCRDLVLYVNDLKHKIMYLKHQNNQLKCRGVKDVDDPPPPPLPPTPQAISSSSLSNSSPAHSSVKGGVSGGGATQTSPAHLSHDRVSSGHVMMPSPALSQPVGSGHYIDSSQRQQSYHPMTPHATLISTSSQRPKSFASSVYAPPPTSHLMFPSQAQEGRYAILPGHRGDQRRQSTDPSLLRLLEEDQQYPTQPSQFRSQQQTAHSQLLPLDPYEQTRGLSKPEVLQEFQETPPTSQTEDRIQFANDEFSHSVATLTGSGGGGGSNSQLGPMGGAFQSQPPLSQEHLMMSFLADGSQKMTYYDMSQPDMIYYHQQRHPYRTHAKQQTSPQMTKRTDKRMSLTDLSAIQQSSDMNSALSRSVLTLHEDAGWAGDGLGGQAPRMAMHRSKPFHHSQGALDTPMNKYGPPGLASTISARLAHPSSVGDPHHGGPPMIWRQTKRLQQRQGRQRLANHTATNGATGQSQIQEKHDDHLNQSAVLMELKEEKRESSIAVSNSSSTSSSKSGSPPESIIQSSQLTQDSQQQPKLRSSGRRYTQAKIRLTGGVEGRHTPTIHPTVTEQKQQEAAAESSSITNRLSVGHRASSNTSLAAEII